MNKDWVKLFKLTTFSSTSFTCDVSIKDWECGQREWRPTSAPSIGCVLWLSVVDELQLSQ